jgi:hypothetical protein
MEERMEPEDLIDVEPQADEEFEDDAEFEAEDWDEEALGLDVDSVDTESIAREISAWR